MNATQLIIVAFLGTALLLYIVLGGADFGAGILELFLGRRRRADQQRVISRAMAPVWEANHVWLILVIVILFNAFPRVFSLISIHLFLPVLAVLMGIVARGCAFTFRYYDTLDRAYYRLFSRAFAAASLWTPFFLGVVGAATIVGRIYPDGQSFYDLYLAAWLNWFAMAMGLFTCCLFAFLAAVYLVGETDDTDLQRRFARHAQYATGGVIVSGALVFASAHGSGFPLLAQFLRSTLSMICFVVATLCWVPLWLALARGMAAIVQRTLAALIVSAVLVGWYALQFPVILRLQTKEQVIALQFLDVVAPEPTLRALLYALIVGSLLIFPALFYLLRIFKWQTVQDERRERAEDSAHS